MTTTSFGRRRVLAAASLALSAGLALAVAPAVAQDKTLVGLVSIAATEANNVRYIKGAEAAAAELGW